MHTTRIRHFPVARLAAVIVALAAAVTLASVAVAVAGSVAAKQQVQITIQGNDSGPGTFKLTPLQGGAVKQDSGATNVALNGPRVVMREGQRIEIWNNVWTHSGKRGSLTIKERLEWIDAGDNFIGVGTWKVVRGTGAYAGVTGSGGTAETGTNHGNGKWVIRQDGFLTLR